MAWCGSPKDPRDVGRCTQSDHDLPVILQNDSIHLLERLILLHIQRRTREWFVIEQYDSTLLLLGINLAVDIQDDWHSSISDIGWQLTMGRGWQHNTDGYGIELCNVEYHTM